MSVWLRLRSFQDYRRVSQASGRSGEHCTNAQKGKVRGHEEQLTQGSVFSDTSLLFVTS